MLASTALLGSAFLSSCTTEDTVTPSTDSRTRVASASGTDTKMTITGLQKNQLYVFSVNGVGATKILAVNAADESSITVLWTRDPLDHTPDTVNYQAVSQVTNADPVSGATAITWATATKASNLTIYETADNTSGHGSGLVLGDGTTRVASVLGADATKLDLVLASNSAITLPFLSLVAPSVSSLTGITGGRQTVFDTNVYQIGGDASNQQFTTTIAGTFPTSGSLIANQFDIPDGDFKDTSVVLLVYTADNHYARVEIIPQTNPSNPSKSLLWKDVPIATAPYSVRAIVVNAWYQPTVGWGYVGRPTAIRRGTNDVPVHAHLVRQ